MCRCTGPPAGAPIDDHLTSSGSSAGVTPSTSSSSLTNHDDDDVDGLLEESRSNNNGGRNVVGDAKMKKMRGMPSSNSLSISLVNLKALHDHHHQQQSASARITKVSMNE